jgi:hypothetical protein
MEPAYRHDAGPPAMMTVVNRKTPYGMMKTSFHQFMAGTGRR